MLVVGLGFVGCLIGVGKGAIATKSAFFGKAGEGCFGGVKAFGNAAGIEVVVVLAVVEKIISNFALTGGELVEMGFNEGVDVVLCGCHAVGLDRGITDFKDGFADGLAGRLRGADACLVGIFWVENGEVVRA